jgi:hypothetical protein
VYEDRTFPFPRVWDGGIGINFNGAEEIKKVINFLSNNALEFYALSVTNVNQSNCYYSGKDDTSLVLLTFFFIFILSACHYICTVASILIRSSTDPADIDTNLPYIILWLWSRA